MRGAIFDVDGTLLCSMNAWYNAVANFFRVRNIDYDKSQMESFKDMPLEESLPIIKRDYNLDMSMHDILKELMELVRIEYEQNIPAKAGAYEYFKKLHNDGVKIAIATSGYKELCEGAFRRLGMWEYIDACAFSTEVMKNKSHPDVYLLAAERIGVDPHDCTVFEDITIGIGGAKKGGFDTVAVADESNTAEQDELKQVADRFINDFTELL